MECNKDEATRAMEIALRKFNEGDLSGSKKFAIKAQHIYPGLEGISQLLTTVDVHISAVNRVGGEMDLYKVLGVNPMADEETIKKQYRKLLLLLHPDKNKSLGADTAFNFVLEAFTVLSDKTKRFAYDTQRHIKMAHKVPSHSTASVPAPRGKPGRKSGTHKASRQTKSISDEGNTFWTVCGACKMQYEYMRVYINQSLKCPNCNRAFVAVETLPPSNLAPLRPEELRVNSSHGGARGRWTPTSEGPSKRMREMGPTDMGRANGFSVYNARVNVNRELSATEIKNLLAEKALLQMREALRRSKLASDEKAAAKEKAKVKQNERQKSKQELETDEISSAPPVFIVPDPDFHVFDHDRSERCFRENQVWAGYDNDDGMPRFYALIHGVVSYNPFKLKLSWLNSRSNTEFSTLDWVGRGFTKTCGDFWVGKYETSHALNSFSHRVKFERGPRGVIQIYPRKGDIWALYRNWSPEWNQGTPDEVIHAYDMVEVLHDYSDERGVYVAPILKAAGFRTVFQPDPEAVRHIPNEEMFRFSHQVPHHILRGNEKANAPKGFVELDPAATPLELLQETVATNKN